MCEIADGEEGGGAEAGEGAQIRLRHRVMFPNIIADIAAKHPRGERENGGESRIDSGKCVDVRAIIRREKRWIEVNKRVSSKEPEKAGAENPAGTRLFNYARETFDQLPKKAHVFSFFLLFVLLFLLFLGILDKLLVIELAPLRLPQNHKRHNPNGNTIRRGHIITDLPAISINQNQA